MLEVTVIEGGEAYSYAGRTLEITGDYYEGDLTVDERAIGTYKRNDAELCVITLDDGRTWTVESEDEYAAMALEILA